MYSTQALATKKGYFDSNTASGSTLLNGLIAYWKMNEVSGSRADSYDNRTLSDTNGVGATAGMYGNAASFIAANAEALDQSVSLFPYGSGSFTLDFWYNTDGTKTSFTAPFWGPRGTLSTQFQVYHDSTTLYVDVQVDATKLSVSTALIKNATTYVRAWYDNSDGKLRLKLNEGATTTSAGTQIGSIVPGTDDTRIGTWNYGSYQGWIDEMGAWGRPLTVAEGAARYNGGVGNTYPFTAGPSLGDDIYLSIGDSKTIWLSESPVGASLNHGLWQWELTQLQALDRFQAISTLGRGWDARGGTTVPNWAAVYIAGDLASMTGQTPRRILLNLGTVDYEQGWGSGDYAEAAWKAYLATLLDAIHTKWPCAHVYYHLPWRVGRSTEADQLATWVSDTIASRSAWAHLGPDERVWAKGSDNGATMYYDGVHYSAAGVSECAAQWQTVLSGSLPACP